MSAKNLPSVKFKKGNRDFYSSVLFVDDKPHLASMSIYEFKPKKGKTRFSAFDFKPEELQQLFDMFKAEGLVK
jgi:hypothetical protein